ncbi:uncharacterized protein ACNFOS_000655 [Eudromia elegans]
MNYLFPSDHKSPCAIEREMEKNVFPGLAGRKQQEHCCERFSKAHQVFKEIRNEDNGGTETPEVWECSGSALAAHNMTVPLSLEEVALNHPVLVTKSVTAHWTNYADNEEEIL